MAFPSRNSSLTKSKPATYRFTGSTNISQQDEKAIIYNVTPETIFDDTEEFYSNEFNEKTGFSTPNSDTDRPLAFSYPSHSISSHKTPQRPLIHYVKNDWQIGSTQGTGERDDDFCPEAWTDLLCSRAFRRWMLLCIIATVGIGVWWFKYVAPERAKTVASDFLIDSLKGRFEDDSEYGYFGFNKRVEFAGMRHLEVLDRELVPGSKASGIANRRLIIVGDVHGCAKELNMLLEQVSFDSKVDHLISTGDMVSKGPSSAEVIDIMMNLNASCVRGNNEDRVLHAHRDHHAPSHQKVLMEHSSFAGPSMVPLKHGHKKDLALASTLSQKQISYILSCPLILNLGEISSMGSNVSVVHAGLVPGVALEKQDPSAVMTMRSIDLRNQVPSPRRAPDPSKGPPPRPPGRGRFRKPDFSEWDEQGRLAVLPWGDVWDAFQDLIPTFIKEGAEREKLPPPPPSSGTKEPKSPSKSPKQNTKSARTKPAPANPEKQANPYKNLKQTSVIYGHDSHAGIVEGKWHFGLDGGCFRGGKLAAMIIEESNMLSTIKHGRVSHRIVTVQCQDYSASAASSSGSTNGEQKQENQHREGRQKGLRL